MVISGGDVHWGFVHGVSSVRGYLKMQCLSFRLNIRSSGSSVSCESQRLNSTCLAQKSGREKGGEERRPGARGLSDQSCDRYMGEGGSAAERS